MLHRQYSRFSKHQFKLMPGKYGLRIFENQILCLKTDGDWYYNCDTLKFDEKCEVFLFIKCLEELHEIAAQHYFQKEKEEF